MKTDSFMNSLNKFIDKKIGQNMSNVGYGRYLFRDGDHDILIGSSDDAMVIEFKEEELIKMAIGFVTDMTGTFAEPGIVFGAGNGEGDNRGFITKDTNSLNLYYIGDLSEDEVAGLAIYKNKIESTVPITVNAGLVDEFILDGTNWAAKLTEADAKAILENPAKAWEIPAANLKATDVAYWNSGGAEAGAAAAAISTIEAALNIVSDLPTEVTMGTFGIKAAVDSTHYAQLTGGGLYIKNGAISIENSSGNTMLSGSGIVADYIYTGTLTGITIQTAASGNERIVMNSSGGIVKTDENGYKRLQIDTSSGGGTINFLRDSLGVTDQIRGQVFESAGNFVVRPQNSFIMILGAAAHTTELYGTMNFTNATVTGLSAVWG